MKELLEDYKETLKKVEVELSFKEYQLKQYTDLEKGNRKYFNRSVDALTITEEVKVLRSEIRDIEFVIQWLESGRMPGQRRGIDRRSAYQREVPFETYWIQRKKDDNALLEFEIVENYDGGNLFINEEEKSEIVRNIVSCLTDRQRTMVSLVANGYTHEEIAKLLNVSKGTVDVTISRSRAKIVEAGWFIP